MSPEKRIDSFIWSHRIGDCRIAALRRSGKHGPFLVFELSKLYRTASGWTATSSFNESDLECLRLLTTHGRRFARGWEVK